MSIAIHSRDFFRPYIVATALRADRAHDLRFVPWPPRNDNPISPRPHTCGRDTARILNPRGLPSVGFTPQTPVGRPAASFDHSFHDGASTPEGQHDHV